MFNVTSAGGLVAERRRRTRIRIFNLNLSSKGHENSSESHISHNHARFRYRAVFLEIMSRSSTLPVLCGLRRRLLPRVAAGTRSRWSCSATTASSRQANYSPPALARSTTLRSSTPPQPQAAGRAEHVQASGEFIGGKDVQPDVVVAPDAAVQKGSARPVASRGGHSRMLGHTPTVRARRAHRSRVVHTIGSAAVTAVRLHSGATAIACSVPRRTFARSCQTKPPRSQLNSVSSGWPFISRASCPAPGANAGWCRGPSNALGSCL